MTNQNNLEQFKDSINRALNEFERRLEQQSLFQLQNQLLKSLQAEINQVDFCNSDKIKILSAQYLDFRIRLNETGRSYEHIVAEKNLVDTFSAFEKFLFDCFYNIYDHFPKFLGNEVSINTADLFLENNFSICKKNVIESKVKSIIQSNNIKLTIDDFKKKFKINILYDDNEIWLLYEVSLIRNLIVHNNSIVNRLHKENLKKIRNPKYELHEGETVFRQLDTAIDDIKLLSTNYSQKITNGIITDSRRLYEYHKNL